MRRKTQPAKSRIAPRKANKSPGGGEHQAQAAEAALRESEARFRLVMEHANDAIVYLDLNGMIQWASLPTTVLTGRPMAELVGRPVMSVFTPEAAVVAETRLAAVRRGEAVPPLVEFEILRQDGRLVVVEANITSVQEAKGVVGRLLVLRDITVRKQAEGALKESATHHRAILDSAMDAIITITQQGRIVEFNPAAETVFGYARGAVIGKEMAELIIPPSLRERHRMGVARYLAMGVASILGKRIEITAMHADGAEFPVELTITQIVLAGQTFFTAFIRDITGRKETAEREAARLRKMRQLSELGMKLSGDPATVFEHVVRMLGELFEVRVVCLSEIVGEELFFKAVYRSGQVFQDAGRCPLDITPCATVEATKDLRVYDRVMERFPKASFLRDHNAFAYCGVPSIDGEGRVVAVTCLLDDKPHEFSEEDQEILRVIGQRITAEVERGRSITERKQAEETIRENAKLIRAIFKQAPLGIAVINSHTGQFLEINEKYCAIAGFSENEMLSRTFQDITHPEDLQADLNNMKLLLEGKIKSFEMDKRYIRKDNSTVWVHLTVVPLWWGAEHPRLHIAMVDDITERKRKEEERAQLLKEVQDGHARLQHLSRRMLEVQEEERRRISRELHDQTGQSLTSLLIGLRTLEEASTLDTTRAQAKILRKITAQALDEVKRLAIGLRPALLDDLGLEAALTRLTEESTQTYCVSMDLHIKGLTNHRLPPQMETGLYRITQEALTNTGRHAAAKSVSVLLTCSKSSVKLIIEDDGRGFNVEKALRLPGSSNHLGLLGMHERVALLNGTISVESTPGSGTTIYVQLPLEAQPS